jgi:hypothetical protein
MEGENGVPIVPIATVHVQVICYVLFAYAQMISRSSKPLQERNAILRTIESLRQRIAALNVSEGGGQPFLISEDELTVVTDGLAAFTANIAYFFPESTKRDEVMFLCEELRGYLAVLFSEPSTPINEEQQEKEE